MGKIHEALKRAEIDFRRQGLAETIEKLRDARPDQLASQSEKDNLETSLRLLGKF